MPTLQITLPESQHQFVLNRVAELGLDCPDQYFEKLIREDRQRKLEDYYMEKVNEGLASGPPIRVTEENREAFWNGICDEILQRHENRCTKEPV